MESVAEANTGDFLRLAARVYEGLSAKDIDEMAQYGAVSFVAVTPGVTGGGIAIVRFMRYAAPRSRTTTSTSQSKTCSNERS